MGREERERRKWVCDWAKIRRCLMTKLGNGRCWNKIIKIDLFKESIKRREQIKSETEQEEENQQVAVMVKKQSGMVNYLKLLSSLLSSVDYCGCCSLSLLWASLEQSRRPNTQSSDRSEKENLIDRQLEAQEHPRGNMSKAISPKCIWFLCSRALNGI